MIRVASAPVSFGVFELTAGASGLPGPDDVLAAIAAAGYEGTELGPPGFLGDAPTTRQRLDRHGLELAGAYVPIDFGPDQDLTELEGVLRLLPPSAPPILADSGPRRPVDWPRLAAGVTQAAELARVHGFAPVFHHHGGTRIERPDEIERLLELTDVALLLDTGHLALAGGDPTQGLRDWRSRIEDVHVKDVRPGVTTLEQAWSQGGFCPLGDGVLALDRFFDELAGYAGWLVVEQDRLEVAVPAAGADQTRSRRWLRDRGI